MAVPVFERLERLFEIFNIIISHYDFNTIIKIETLKVPRGASGYNRQF
jgi:hypothetical protein